jgi:glutaminyl-peptide cyclotransferase
MQRKYLLGAVLVAVLLVASGAAIVVLQGLKSPGDTNPAVTPTPTATPTETPMLTPTQTTMPTPTPTQTPQNNQGPTNYTYSIVHTYPHDASAFTEGLVYIDGNLYESTGSFLSSAPSSLRRVDLSSGDVLQQQVLDSQYFGEGIAVVNDTIIQLTWQSHVGFVYGKDNFTLLRTFSYSTEGWGLTYNGSCLIMSDGSSNLYFLEPSSFQVIGQVSVKDGNRAVTNINELEYINGDVYANIWMDTKIAIINPSSGQVKAWIDLTGIHSSSNIDNVLNGIAYDQQNGRLFVTGKNWPSLYEIKLVPKS